MKQINDAVVTQNNVTLDTIFFHWTAGLGACLFKPVSNPGLMQVPLPLPVSINREP